MDRYVVIGNPVAHSLSPEIHARFAAAEGERIAYDRLLVPEGEFAAHAQRFFDAGGCGANITLPFKLDAFAFAAQRSDRALAAGAANFLARRGERIEADNTDGVGLVTDLRQNHGVDLEGASVLLIGAGGAARGVIAPLVDANVSRIVIANRTVERARDLVRHFHTLGEVTACSLDAIPGPFEVVINATSTSTRGEALALPSGVIARGTFAYDMAYGPAALGFVQRATHAGARASDGLGMLVEQAAESYFLWRGRRPATGPVLRELRARFS